MNSEQSPRDHFRDSKHRFKKTVEIGWAQNVSGT
jgi:hypothetical protein